MSKSSTGGGGRGGYDGDIIGTVIFHGRKKFWDPSTSFHYHVGMEAGENTLEALLARRAVSVTAEAGHFSEEQLRADYVSFMTTPGTHNDTYCGTCHRMFFANLDSGVPPEKCPDSDGHNVDNSDSIVATVPVALTAHSDDEAFRQVARMVAITRKSEPGQAYARLFASMLRRIVVDGASVGAVASAAAAQIRYKIPSPLTADPVTA